MSRIRAGAAAGCPGLVRTAPIGRAHGITGSLATHRGDAASPDAVSRGGTDQGGPRAYPRRDPMCDYLPVIDLVARAGKGDKRAWDALVERYSPLIWSICRGHRLGDADARAVSQSIWRQLVNQLDEVQDPGALAGWLAAAAWRECGNARSAAGGLQIAGDIAGARHQPRHQAGTGEQERLAAERHAALREAFSRLSPGCQRPLTLLTGDLPCRTPRSAPGWASRSAASGRPAAAAWISSAATP